ncbi:MAG: tail fiber domain-containing protein, partial [Candidatus Thermoplasmatota archaeon]|nr:tail fiber domain-containing protein [Candidatus Thermoplasmatota archaeon]
EKQLILTDGALTPGSNAIVDLGTDALEFKDAYFDGTVEADAITIGGSTLASVIQGTTVTNATNAAHVSVADNESTDENNLIPFIEDTSATGNVGLESDGDFHYNPSTGRLTATQLAGTLQTAAQGNITSLGTLTTLTVDDITINGSTISDGGDLTIDAEGDITIDANGADIILKDDGTAFGRFKRDTSDFVIKSETNDKDILFKGVDNTSTITALTLDMSEAGAATFGGGIADAGTIGAGTWQGTDVAVSHGGTGASTFTDGGVLLGSGTSAITATAVLGNGELLIGDNSTDPTVATLTGTANQITVTNGGGSITLSTPQSIDTGADVTFGTVRVDDATAASSKTTGALIVDGGVGVGLDIHAGGDVVAYASSDVKLKDNIEVIEDSLDKISEIRGVKFDWNEESPDWAQERGHDVGVIAQEVQKVLPEIVTERTNGYLGVDYKRIIPLLIESIKELKQEVEDLKKKVN